MGSPVVPSIIIPYIRSHDKQIKKRQKKYKSLSIYLNSKRRHEASDVEFPIVQPLKKLLGIGNTTPPRVVFIINHGVWAKHELRCIHQNLWVIPTHQLAPYNLRQK